MDRISNLPDEVIDLILTRLTLNESVRTSAICKSWRYRWTCLSSLSVNYDFPWLVRKFRGGSPLACAYIINSILSQHVGNFRKFFLSPTVKHMHDFSVFEPSIRKATRSTTLETLEVAPYAREEDGQVLATLPSSIFSSVSLKHLVIYCCHFYPPSWFKGLPNLTYFSLDASSPRADAVSHFISVCPRLEEVRLFRIQFVNQDLELDAPKLKFLRVTGIFKDIIISNAPNLESVLMWVFPGEEADNIVDMFKHFNSLGQVDKITLNCVTCKLLGRCSAVQMLPKFSRIKEITFMDLTLHADDELKVILSILAASPNVEKLELLIGHEVQDVVDPLQLESIFEKYIHNNFRCLVKVELSNICGTELDRKIVEWLLRFSPVLELLRVKLAFKATKDEKIQFFDSLLNFYRASTEVKFDVW